MAERFICRIDQLGRILIPAKLRRELGIKPGEELILVSEEGNLRLETRARALARAKALVRELAPAGTSLADELLAERRKEALREERTEPREPAASRRR